MKAVHREERDQEEVVGACGYKQTDRVRELMLGNK